MIGIETKYYDYCKVGSILCAWTNSGPAKTNPIYMNTNTIIKISLSVVSLCIVAFVANTHHTADYLPAMTTGVSYFAVLALVAVAAIDYRASGPKSVTGR